DLVHDLAVLEEQKQRDRPDVETARGADVLIDVEPGDLDAALVLDRELVQDGRDHPTGPAPGRPEIDDSEPRVLLHLVLERRVGHRQCVRHALLTSSNASLTARVGVFTFRPRSQPELVQTCKNVPAARPVSPTSASRCEISKRYCPSTETCSGSPKLR